MVQFYILLVRILVIIFTKNSSKATNTNKTKDLESCPIAPVDIFIKKAEKVRKVELIKNFQTMIQDKNISNLKASIPSILTVGAVHSHLVKHGLRGYCSLNVECSDALDTHSFAVLIGVGATTVNPYLAIDSIYQRFEKKLFGKADFESCVVKFKKSIDAGLLKIMSKMGISVISSYRGGCNFEAVGLSRAIVSDYFSGMSSRISGIGIIGIEKKIKELHKKFNAKNVFSLPIGGLYRYRKSGENHQYQGKRLI